MTVTVLTPDGVAAAAPMRRPYTIRDREVTGLGLRIVPSGRKTFIVNITRKGTRYSETLGNADAMPLADARAHAARRIAMITALHKAGPETPFEAMADVAMHRMARFWKSTTMRSSRSTLENAILPYFSGRAIASISRGDVEDWFAGLHATPGAANRAVPLLSIIMREAEEAGARLEGANPTRGLRRYRRPRPERTLTPEETARLGRILERMGAAHPLKVAMIRLLVLTGCRVGELSTLEWRDYRGGHLHLRDSKSGPRTVFLSSPAREVLDGLRTRRSRLVFPSPRRGSSGKTPRHGPDAKGHGLKGHGAKSHGVERRGAIEIGSFWRRIRVEAGIDDVRLHDLRHNYASQAISQGESLRIVGTLLGHAKPESTLRYIHLEDAQLLKAVQKVDGAMARGRARGPRRGR